MHVIHVNPPLDDFARGGAPVRRLPPRSARKGDSLKDTNPAEEKRESWKGRQLLDRHLRPVTAAERGIVVVDRSRPAFRARRSRAFTRALVAGVAAAALLALPAPAGAQGATLTGELAIDLSSGFGLQLQPLPESAPALYLDYHRNEANTGTSLGGRYVLKHEGSCIRLSLGAGARFADGQPAATGPYVLAGIEWFIFFWESEWVLTAGDTPEHRSGLRFRFR